MSVSKLLRVFLAVSIMVPAFAIYAQLDKIDLMIKIIALYNLLFALSFFLVVNSVINRRESFYSTKNLIIYSFPYIVFFFLILNITYYIDHGDFFEFVASDTFTYDNAASKMKDLGFIERIIWWLNNAGFLNPSEDLGGVLMPSIAYSFYYSTFSYNVLNMFAGIFTGINMFSLASNFMSKRWAFVASFIYIISSFSIYFYTTGAKESFFILFVVASYNYIYKVKRNASFMNILWASVFVLSILFYRPAVLYMILLSLGFSVLFKKSRSNNSAIMIFLGLILSVVLSSVISQIFNRYLGGNLNAKMVNGIEKSSLNYIIASFSALLGPFPTVVPFETKAALSISSTGLIFRVLSSTYFVFGALYIIKQRISVLYPILIFIFMEMLALVLILEVFELRLNFPHYPFIYIIAFYFYDNYSINSTIVKHKYIRIGIGILSFFILVWNFRD